MLITDLLQISPGPHRGTGGVAVAVVHTWSNYSIPSCSASCNNLHGRLFVQLAHPALCVTITIIPAAAIPKRGAACLKPLTVSINAIPKHPPPAAETIVSRCMWFPRRHLPSPRRAPQQLYFPAPFLHSTLSSPTHHSAQPSGGCPRSSYPAIQRSAHGGAQLKLPTSLSLSFSLLSISRHKIYTIPIPTACHPDKTKHRRMFQPIFLLADKCAARHCISFSSPLSLSLFPVQTSELDVRALHMVRLIACVIRQVWVQDSTSTAVVTMLPAPGEGSLREGGGGLYPVLVRTTQWEGGEV